MTQLRAYIPYVAALEDLVDEIIARAPGSSGFETDEILIICDGIRSAATITSQLRLEVIRGADETESLSTRIWIRNQPGIEDEIVALTEQFAADFAAFRIVHIDAAERDVRAIREILGAV